MATAEEIERRVEETDIPRTAKRSTAAKRVSDLARRRTAIAEQLSDIERELGDVLAASRDVMEIDELARFTDVPAADLARWLEARKSSRTKRKRPTAGAPRANRATGRDPSATGIPATTPTAGPAATPPVYAKPGADTADAPARAATG